MKIFLDFDGTVVEHTYPKIGRCNFGCFEVIKKLQDAGHEIILNTMRSEFKNDSLEKALDLINNFHWMLIKDRSQRETFEIKPIKSTDHKIQPGCWDIERAKVLGELFIDDICTGTPLKPAVMTNGKMVDWDELDKIFEKNGLYESKSDI